MKKEEYISKQYTERLAFYDQYIKLPKSIDGYYHSFYGYPILVRENSKFTRHQIVNHLEKDGIETRAFMGGDLSKQPAYRSISSVESGKDMKNTQTILNNAFFIGCHPFVTDNQIDKVVSSFVDFFDNLEQSSQIDTLNL